MPKKLSHILTATAAERLRPTEPGKRRDVADGTVPGLFLRVAGNGAKSWSLLYRRKLDGQLRRFRVGDFPALDLKAARKSARATLEAIERGADPAGDKARARVEKRMAQEAGLATPGTVAWAAALFDAEHIAAKKPRTQVEQRRAINKVIVPAWGARPLTGIAKADVITLIKTAKAKSGPVAANRLLTMAKTFFGWCVNSDLTAANPCLGLKTTSETPRDRVLSDAELMALWTAFGETPYPFGPYFKLLALLGQRRHETAIMRRADLRDQGAAWVIPRATRKAGGEHLVPLPTFAREIIAELPEFKKGDHLFSTTDGLKAISGYSKPKARADALARASLAKAHAEGGPKPDILDGWRLHDLRRTMATWMGSADIAPHVVAAVLGHVDSSVTRRHYNLHTYAKEKAAALEAWAEHVRALVTGRAAVGNVVALRG